MFSHQIIVNDAQVEHGISERVLTIGVRASSHQVVVQLRVIETRCKAQRVLAVIRITCR